MTRPRPDHSPREGPGPVTSRHLALRRWHQVLGDSGAARRRPCNLRNGPCDNTKSLFGASAWSATMAGKADVDPTPYLNKWVGEPCTSAHVIHRLLRHRNFCWMHTDMSSSAHNTTHPRRRLLRGVHDIHTAPCTSVHTCICNPMRKLSLSLCLDPRRPLTDSSRAQQLLREHSAGDAHFFFRV
jgi:hypothetical protein